MEKSNSRKIVPISDTQAAIGVGVIFSFFVLWLLIGWVSDDFLKLIGGKNNLSGWVQAIGSILAVLIAIAVPYGLENKKLQKEKNNKKLEATFFLLNYIETVESNRRNISHAVKTIMEFEIPPKTLFRKFDAVSYSLAEQRQESSVEALNKVARVSLDEANMVSNLDDDLPFYMLRLSGLCQRCADKIRSSDISDLKDKDSEERGEISLALKEIDFISAEILRICYLFV